MQVSTREPRTTRYTWATDRFNNSNSWHNGWALTSLKGNGRSDPILCKGEGDPSSRVPHNFNEERSLQQTIYLLTLCQKVMGLSLFLNCEYFALPVDFEKKGIKVKSNISEFLSWLPIGGDSDERFLNLKTKLRKTYPSYNYNATWSLLIYWLSTVAYKYKFQNCEILLSWNELVVWVSESWRADASWLLNDFEGEKIQKT